MGLLFRLLVNQRKRIKRRRRRPELEIPMEVVTGEILTRLPAKSLMRFKCASKPWSWLIRSRNFNKRFLTVASPRLYMCLADLSNHHEDVILSLAPDATCSSFVVDHDLTIPRKGGYILQSLGGFMCYVFMKQLRIYNPATRQLVTLPAIKSNREFDKFLYFYFGHDPVDDQYKAICSVAPYVNIMPEHWVFVLKADGGGSWKKAAPPTAPDFCPHIPDRRGALCIDGVIYYLALTAAIYNYVLVSFHIRSEEFKMIPIPRLDNGDDLLPRRLRYLNLIEYGRKVTLLDHTNLRDKGMLDLWHVEVAGTKEWSRKTLVLQPSQLHLVNNTDFKVRGTTQSGKVFLIPHDLISPLHILCYDLPSNDLRTFEIKGVPDHWFSKDKADARFDSMFMDQSESVMHLET